MATRRSKIARKLVEAGGWKLARRIAKQVPVVGSALAIGLVGYDIKQKGVVRGILNSGLDAIPIVGTGKNVIEMFTGDLLADKENVNGNKRLPVKEDLEI